MNIFVRCASLGLVVIVCSRFVWPQAPSACSTSKLTDDDARILLYAAPAAVAARKAAAELFLDPLAISELDLEHSDTEERWVTMGRDRRGRVLVLIHTFKERPGEDSNVRIISARRATRREAKQYKG